jgi:hypothetical protein
VRNASDRWRRKPADALLLQVTADLPNAAEYEADRHRDSDFDNHQQHQSHRYLWAGAGRRQSTHQRICTRKLLKAANRPLPNFISGTSRARASFAAISQASSWGGLLYEPLLLFAIDRYQLFAHLHAA